MTISVGENALACAGDQILNLAFGRCAAVVIGPPMGTPGVINNGSAFVVRLGDRFYLGTAWHVVQSWLTRTAGGEDVIFQVRDAELKPSGSVVWKDEVADLVFLRLTVSEVERIGILAFDARGVWPPSKPSVGDFLVASGFPAVLREHDQSGLIDLGNFAAVTRVTTLGDRHLISQFERHYWVPGAGLDIPPEGVDLGGMSGGPVFVVRHLSYPLVGVITQHNSGFELMHVATLSHVPDLHDLHAA